MQKRKNNPSSNLIRKSAVCGRSFQQNRRCTLQPIEAQDELITQLESGLTPARLERKLEATLLSTPKAM